MPRTVSALAAIVRIKTVVSFTGCTEKFAREELLGEEWDDSAAIRNIREYQTGTVAIRPEWAGQQGNRFI